MFSRVLVPTDFSAPSEAALAHARSLADTFGATLHVLHVVDNMFLRAVLGDPRDYEAAARRRLADALAPDGLRAIGIVERSDEPADEIIRYARAHEIELIVMGTHGRGRVAHLMLGSVAERVARTAPCPVLTLREPPPAAADGIHLLVATDFSAAADAALGYAKRLAARQGASIRLLHVVDDFPAHTPFGSEVYVPEVPGLRTEQLQAAQQKLARRVLGDRRSRVRLSTEVIFGPAARTITAYAEECGFNLIVMGTHGRTGLKHFLMGSVADSVIRTAPCPVLTVRDLHERGWAQEIARVAAEVPA